VEFVLIALAVIAGLILLGFVLSRVVMSNHARRARKLLPPPGPADYEETAIGLTAPYKAYGLLRVTPAEVLFASGQLAEVLQLPRRTIGAAFASEDVPTGAGMQTLRRQALVLQIRDPRLPQGLGFMVSDPQSWAARLKG
jgi:hypothetical protein